jgi:ADP-ribose pyrophosphatase YjhB (NUDIX family)
MTVRRSAALVIRDDARPGMLLLVQRPEDDADLPGAWGLPSASLREDEDWHEAARRAGRDKLGLVLEPGIVLNEGTKQRTRYRLAMRLVDARITSGTVQLDAGPADGTTRYQAWCWAPVTELQSAADRGSLCSRLALEVLGHETS